MWLPFLTRFEDVHLLFARDQKNGVYVNYSLSESSMKNLQKGKTVNNSIQGHHSVTHFLQVVWGLLGKWMLKTYNCTGQAEPNFLVQAHFLCNSACDSCHAKVQHLRHTHPNAFNMQAECQFKDLRNTMKREKKEVDNIFFTISLYIVLSMKHFPRDEFNHDDIY